VFSKSQVQDNYRAVHDRVLSAALRAGRAEGSVLLLPVSKMHPAGAIEALYELGVRDFGESRVQELLKKKNALPGDIRWHFIGNLQSNKVRQIVDFVDLIHSVHTLALADEISRRATAPVSVLLEVNISGEASKSGADLAEAPELLREIERTCPNVSVVGLMGMASYEDEPERTRPQFRALRELRDSLQATYPKLVQLSMGMTNDYEIAIEEGSTVVRVGSAIFGEREY
jgi:pyridoxal phosphate enzyme (YggS family)